jgi:hypothetical protein
MSESLPQQHLSKYDLGCVACYFICGFADHGVGQDVLFWSGIKKA